MLYNARSARAAGALLLSFSAFFSPMFLASVNVFADEAAAEPEPASTNAPAPVAEGTVREAYLDNGRGGRQKVKIRYEDGGWVVLGRPRGGVSTNDIATVHAPDATFLEINGDRLTWAAVDEQIDMVMAMSPLKIPKIASAEEVAIVMATERRKHAQLLLDGYIENALLAHEARKAGYSVSRDEVAAVMGTAMKGVPLAKRKAYMEKVLNPDSYFFRNQANFVLGAKYRDGVLAAGIEVSEDEKAEVVRENAAAIARAKEADAALKPRMDEILSGLRDGSVDFEDAVFDESDKPDGDSGEWEEFEKSDVEDDDESFTREMQDFAFGARAGEYGGVFESEDGYVILKVLKTDAKDGAPAGKVSLARIVKERVDVPDEMDDARAAELVRRRKLADRISEAKVEALDSASITSAMPTKVLGRIVSRARRRQKELQKARAAVQERDGKISEATNKETR